MFLVHMDKQASGLGPNCTTMSVEASAFQVQNVKDGTPNDTMTVIFYDAMGRPVNAYTGVKAVEEAQVQLAKASV